MRHERPETHAPQVAHRLGVTRPAAAPLPFRVGALADGIDPVPSADPIERTIPMSRNGLKKLAITGAVVTAIGLGGVSVAAASSGGGDTGETDTPITGPALDQAGAAALDHLGEGRVTGTEVGDEDSYYEVEVTLDDGSEVDVQLDESFTVVGSEHDVPGDD